MDPLGIIHVCPIGIVECILMGVSAHLGAKSRCLTLIQSARTNRKMLLVVEPLTLNPEP